MIKASCHCQNIQITIKGEAKRLNACVCSVCRRYGAIWGYYKTSDLEINIREHSTFSYMCNDFVLRFHICKRCGNMSHYTYVDETVDEIAVNLRLRDELWTSNKNG